MTAIPTIQLTARITGSLVSITQIFGMLPAVFSPMRYSYSRESTTGALMNGVLLSTFVIHGSYQILRNQTEITS